MNKYFVSYRYLFGYEDGTGQRIYEVDSTLLSLDINTVYSLCDLKEKIFKQELSWMVTRNSNFKEPDIEIITFNKL